ncbi:PLDc N-terminal domain-containing protein [Dictyobacter alpinus]|nr:PLDc N-terminal domain-containing protein [Dictyobacter alpinus]
MTTVNGGAPIFGLIFFGFYCIFGIVGILSTVFWIWMLVDCLRNEPANSNDKVIWVVVIAVTHVVGSIIYFFMRRQPRIRQARQGNIL